MPQGQCEGTNLGQQTRLWDSQQAKSLNLRHGQACSQKIDSVQFSSVAQSCQTLSDPVNRSTPGLPVYHQLPEFTQTHGHRVGDAIQPSHSNRPLPLLPPIPPRIRVFSNESTLRMRWPKYWSFSFSIIPSKEIPGLISFKQISWISLQSKGLSRVFSNTTVNTV